MDLESLGVHNQAILLNHSSFDDFLGTLKPTVVLFDRFPMEEQFGWRVAEFAPQALRILDTEDLHSLRKTRDAAITENTVWNTTYWIQADITKREIASIYRCDLSLIISTFEMQLLRHTLKIDSSLLLHLPFMVGPLSDKIISSWPSFKERSDFIFIGTGMHAPNRDAIKWLKTTIWPQIRAKLPGINCHIYGSYLTQQIREMHAPREGFYVEGEVADVTSVMRTKRINLGPLRFGAGIKGKLMAGMLSGTPNVTTPIGAEGMQGDFSWNGSIASTADEFAAAAIALYADQKEWEKAKENGIHLVNRLYNATAHENNLRRRIEIIAGNLEAHRNQNFIGSLLQHQTMASTEFMSRWIAEKHRK